MYNHRCVWLALIFLAFAGGCAPFAVQTPTPAKDLDVSALWEPRPGEHYYVTVFGSQITPNIPQLSHSWATVVCVIDQEGRPPLIESHTISWLPASLKIRLCNFHVEAPVNLGLHETLAYVLSNGERVSQWGPYECRPSLYYRFQTQKEFLESGRVGYQAIDTVGEAGRTGNGCDCIHAITDMDPQFSRSRYPLIRFGESASRAMVREARRRDVLLNPSQRHDWLNECLGLDAYPIIHRD